MTSLWLDRAQTITDDTLPVGGSVQDLVIGGGLTGLTTALLLARAGRRVAVVEAGTIGAVTTGHSTAKLSLLQGTKLTGLLRHQSQHVAQAYVDGNLEAQQWLLRFLREHDVPFQVRDAITYAAKAGELRAVEKEHRAALSLGLDVHWHDSLDVPFPLHGATVLADQAQFDPLDVLATLVAQIRAHGGTVHQGRRVVDVSKIGRPRIRLEDGTTMRADNVVVATGTPILDRGLYFAKLEPKRSYVLALELPGVPRAMYLSAGSPSRSVRDAPHEGGTDYLLIGGSGHSVGRTRSEAEHLDELRHWTALHFPGSVETHAWSAQDYGSHDGFPYVGKLPRGRGRVYVATGFDKWGMTNGVAAGLNLAGEILGSQPSWARTIGHRVTRPSGAAHVVSINAKVGAAAAVGIAAAESRAATDAPEEGQGRVGREGIVPVGVSTVDGRTCAVRALCTHLGGTLKWNDAERSWDCPLHGSRFAADGTVLEGPAVRALARRDLPGPSDAG